MWRRSHQDAPANTRQSSRCRLAAALFVPLCITLSSCDQLSYETLEDRVDRADLSHSRLAPQRLIGTIVTNAPAIGVPIGIAHANQTLWVSDLALDPALHAVEPTTGTLILSLGRRGEGPGNFVAPPWGFIHFPNDPDGLWVFDPQLQRLTRFEALPLSGYEFQTIRLDGPRRAHRVVHVDAGRLVGLADSEEQRFLFFSSRGTYLGNAPGRLLGPPEAPLSERLKATTRGQNICEWPGRGFVIVNQDVARLEYYDSQARFVRLADVPFPMGPLFVEDTSGKLRFSPRRQAYTYCVATRRHLFAAFSGRLRSAYSDAGFEERSSAEFVHIFDWMGNLRMVLELDRAVFAITLNEAGSALYATSVVDAAIYRYDLRGLRQLIDGG